MASTENAATEQTRLLDHEDSEHDDDDTDHPQACHADANDEPHTPDGAAPLLRERSTRELLAVVGATWLGVFLASLGTFEFWNPPPPQKQDSSCGPPYISNDFQLIVMD
jgi:hypothetical protein